MIDWRRTVFASFSWGAGFAIGLSMIIGIVLWYQQQPKPWDKNAITTTYDYVDIQDNTRHIYFYYVLQNNTALDYSINQASEVVILAKLEEQKSLSGAKQDDILTIEHPIFLPAKQRLRLGILLKYPYAGPGLKADASRDERKEFRKKLEGFIRKEMGNLNGFVLFDEKKHYEIDFPKGW
jgi:hypothetical protein